MLLDTRTILAIDTVVVLALAAAPQFYRSRQRTYPGVSLWILGTWVMGLGYVAMVLRPVLGEHLGVFLANAAFIGAAVVRLDGTVRFTADRRLAPGFSHGICPECRDRLYPDD
jgi:hypothetical protein